MNGPAWRIRLLGDLVAEFGETRLKSFRTQKTASLFAYLVLHPNEAHPRETLVDLLWPDDDPEAARLSLRVALSFLRKQIQHGPEIFASNRSDVRLNGDVFSTDVADYFAMVNKANGSLSPDARLALLLDAHDLYRGELTPHLYDDWAVVMRNSLSESFTVLLRSIVSQFARERKFEAALPYALQCVRRDPLREEVQRDVIRIFAAMGHPSAALKQFEEFKQLLKSELKERPSAATLELVKRVRQKAAEHGSAPSTGKGVDQLGRENTVPAPLTRFFGREKELDRLISIFSSQDPNARLVTLLGLGGNGKSRLSLELCHRLKPFYGCAIWFVALQQCDDGELLTTQILDTITPGHASPKPMDRLRFFFQGLGTPAFLVLDNLEQIASVAALVVKELLRQGRQVRVLVTSRIPLGLDGEILFPLGPLPIPLQLNTSDDLQSPSVQLFVDRAKLANPDFDLTENNAKTVTSICERLDGIPLALEIAASWAAVLTPAQLLGRIEDRFSFLVKSNIDVADHQKSLRAVLESGYSMLPKESSDLLSNLSVFAGEWDLDAAEEVCQVRAVSEHLRVLKNYSFVDTRELDSQETMRFTMLETVRAYADEQLEPGLRQALQFRHLRYHALLAERLSSLEETPAYSTAIRRVDIELPNIRRAVSWALAGPESVEIGRLVLKLLRALRKFYLVHGNSAEALPWIKALLSRNISWTTEETAEGLLTHGAFEHNQGHYVKARALYLQAVEAFGSLQPCASKAMALLKLGNVSGLLGEYESQRDSYTKSLSTAKMALDISGTGSAYLALGHYYARLGESGKSREFYEEGIALCRPLGRTLLLAVALFGTSRAQDAGPDLALERLAECYAIFAEHGYHEHEASCLKAMSEIYLTTKRLKLAEEHLRQALDLHKTEFLESEDTAEYLEAAAAIKIAGLDYRPAQILLGAAYQIRNDLGSRPYPDILNLSNQLKYEAESSLGETAMKLWEKGKTFTADEAMAFALQVLSPTNPRDNLWPSASPS